MYLVPEKKHNKVQISKKKSDHQKGKHANDVNRPFIKGYSKGQLAHETPLH